QALEDHGFYKTAPKSLARMARLYEHRTSMFTSQGILRELYESKRYLYRLIVRQKERSEGGDKISRQNRTSKKAPFKYPAVLELDPQFLVKYRTECTKQAQKLIGLFQSQDDKIADNAAIAIVRL